MSEPINLLKIIKEKDEGWELANIGVEFDLTGDEPCDFLRKIQDFYLTPTPTNAEQGESK